MRINKAWFHDFARSVWHTIDFAAKFSPQVEPRTIAKYGELIRKALSVQKEEHLTLLRHSAVNSLCAIGFFVTNNSICRGLFFDIFYRNKHSLKILDISAHLLSSKSHNERRQNSAHFFSIDLPVSGSNLTELSLEALCLSRDNFSDILRCSPLLVDVIVCSTLLYSYNPTTELVMHQRVKKLTASLQQVWVPDDLLPEWPSLLVHFPQLVTWIDPTRRLPDPTRRLPNTTWDLPNPTWSFPDPPVKMQDLRVEIACCCPRLVEIDFMYDKSDPKDIADLLVEAFTSLEYCGFYYALPNRKTFIGIMEHQETLTRIVLLAPDSKALPSQLDPNPAAKNLVCLILRSCRSLQVFSARDHQMDIATAEQHKWVCGDLKDLQVRFKGLETSMAVDDCLERLSVLRSCGSQGNLGEAGKSDGSIGQRVCRKLFPLRKLNTVWLGSKIYYLATPAH
ncbi:hypothetical protein BGW39_008888 [Mortierella sp. 14UC]|nr:hypothetical protein BGW39_008888 [Mortierella sp. 14UC]